MKTKDLNLGQSLTREEQKKITGGICNAGSYIACKCFDNSVEYHYSDGQQENFEVCYYQQDVCQHNGGVVDFDPACYFF